MEYRILGPVEVWDDDGAEVPFDGTKQRTVLAALLLAKGSLLPDADLSRHLWGDHPPVTFGAQIYNYISRLRKTLGDKVNIVRRAPGYLMRIGDARFDLLEFERLSRRGQAALAAGHYAKAGRLLRAAAGLWRGAALANVSEPLARAEGPRLEEARLSVVESRVE